MYNLAVAKTYVLWDVEDCPVPPDLSPTDALINIRTVLTKSGYFGCSRFDSLSIRPYCRDDDMVDDNMVDDFGVAPVSLVTSGELLKLFFHSQSRLLIYVFSILMFLYLYGFIRQRRYTQSVFSGFICSCNYG